MVFEHEIQAGKETDERVHQALGKAGESPPYSTDKTVAEALAKEVGLEVLPMHEPNRTHYFDSLGVLPEGEPIGYLGYLEVEPDETSDSLLLLHGWLGLSEAQTMPLAVCRSILLHHERIRRSWVICGVTAAT